MDVKRLYGPAAPGTAEVTIYTNGQPTGDTIVRTIGVCNASAGTVQASVSIVAKGGTAGVGNRIVHVRDILAHDTLDIDTWRILHPGDFISVLCSAATTVVDVHGEEGSS